MRRIPISNPCRPDPVVGDGWGEIVREAICFGWIDSRSRRVDDDRTSVYVCPRKSGSMWSAVNKQIIRELEAEDLLMPAGRARIEEAKRDGSWTFLDEVEALVVPEDLAAALAASSLRADWEAATPTSRKRALLDLKTAKRQTTRRKRLMRVVARLAEVSAPG